MSTRTKTIAAASDDDDDDELRQSEPLLSPYHAVDDINQSVLPLPDTMELACILQQIQQQHANRSE
jgi:hypothetical protein